MVKDVDVGQVLAGKYALVRLLGMGAMGQVWAARHLGLQQMFAIKLMTPPTADGIRGQEGERTTLKRFENEAQIAAALSRKSRHIVGVSDYGTDDGVAYLVMELLTGSGLEKRIGDGVRLPANEVNAVISQVAKGLSVAHAEGVTHRDLKPANIFLTHDDEGALLVKILDFGIAVLARRIVAAETVPRAPTKLTMKGLVLGSPGYMSPEQAMAEPTDVRADVWSLAVLAFEALTGVMPFHAESTEATILRICNHRATPLRAVMPEASLELEAIFSRAFGVDIDTRFQTALDLASALNAALPSAAKQIASIPPPRARENQIETQFENVQEAAPRRQKIAVPVAASLAIGAVVLMSLFVSRWVSSHASTPPVATSPLASSSVAPSPVAPSVTEVASATVAPTATSTANAPRATATQRPVVAPPHDVRDVATSAPSVKPVDRSAVF